MTKRAKDDEKRPDNKVARLIREYGLGPEFGDRLEELWTADGDERESLRSLAERFNKRLLEETMTDAGMATVEGEVENFYRLLTDDDVSSGAQTEARMRLEQNDIGIDQLETDFVTYQAIRSYLKDYRGAEYEQETDKPRVDSTVDTINRLQSRVRSVARKRLTQLRDAGHISLGEFRLFVEVTVLCEDCNTQQGIGELLKGGGCECELEEE